MKKNFEHILKGKIVIVGIGNVLRADDAVGPVLVQRLHGTVNAVCIDAGTAPETYLGKIVKEKPDTVLLVDAADLDLEPGAYDILQEDEIVVSGFTTHDMSPHLFIDFIKRETTASVFMLGVQPYQLDFSDEMSECVEKTVNDLANLIREGIHA